MLSMKAIKRPVEVDAWKLDSSIFLYEPIDPSVPVWVKEGIEKGKLKYDEVYNDWSVISLEGLMVAKDGDYVIRGVKGELYPCRGDIFEETYEVIGP